MKRMLLALVFASTGFAAGNDLCASCHRNQVSGHGRTQMARTLEPVQSARILKSHAVLTFKQGEYSYTIQRKGDQSIYRVTDGKEEFTAPIGWGVDRRGRTDLPFQS